MTSKKPPSLRIAVTEKCNLNCSYCPECGDSYSLTGKSIDLEKFKVIVKCAYDNGIRFFSITGGEPLLVPQITFALAEYIKSLGNDIGYLRLNTNGVFIKNHIKEIKKAGFDKVKVSIDSFSTESYRAISGSDLIKNLELAIAGIDEVKKFTEVRLHVVVGKHNIGEVDNIIRRCMKSGIDVKFFDIIQFSNANTTDDNFWRDSYVSLGEISKRLEHSYGEPIIINSPGGYGQPMKVFTTSGGTKVRIRNSEVRARYSSTCESCPEYMCQQGLCNLTLAADGRLKICHQRDIGLNMLKDDCLISNMEMDTVFGKANKVFFDSKESIREFTSLSCNKK